jgi:branched-chain amino acid transport system permease protein
MTAHPSEVERPPQNRSQQVLLGLGALVLAALPHGIPEFYTGLVTSGLIAAMLALSLQLLVGCTGLVSLGHAAFYGLGAYTVYAITPADHSLSLLLTLPAAAAVAGLAALMVGALSLRTRGFFFLMVTLAFGQMVFFIFHNTKLGGGADGAYLLRPSFSLFDWQLPLTRRQRPLAYYYLALILLVAMYLGLHLLLRSLFGRVLQGIRVNEGRMLALGFNTYRYKLAAFAIAGLLAGIAGHMYAMKEGFVNPELVGWHRSAEALLMILLGGLTTLSGPIIGALAYTAIGEVAQLITERKLLVEGLVILLVVLCLPKGLIGGLSGALSAIAAPRWPPRWLPRRPPPARPPSEAPRHG